ncbi:MAG: hypothetical protein LBH37_04370 [Oscillospiraceae bacterium]|jgi:uncharacterized protein (TIGR00661 family)|nr:hypothetical protein [Oscillospiraceae bacterium]
MKKILIGICGIGNGHMNRQRLIIDNLLQYDVDIVLAITQKDYDLFDSLYPTIKKVLIHAPWIIYNDVGIDFESTKTKYLQSGIDYFGSFLDFSISVQKAFNGNNPDFVMTDYERNVAQFAYATGRPLVCLDQHSKFLTLSTETINNFSADVGNSMLLYFFPKAEKRYVSSFFKIEDDKKFNIETIPPVLKNIQKGQVNSNKAVVYFSPYTSEVCSYSKILELIKNYKNYEFNIYTYLEFPDYYKYDNLIFKKIGDQFNNDLSDCSFIVSSSGHQLIVEAINLEIPLYIFPLDTYDQNYCCHFVEKHGLGKKINTCETQEFNNFIENLDLYRENMKKHKSIHYKDKWDKILFEKLERAFGIERKHS